jgi:hypothetical protein
MKQSWQIYNISKGLTLSSIYDNTEILNKSVSIDVLLYLLQSKWRYDKIVITGNLDDTYNSAEHMKDYIDYFLSNYNMKYKDVVRKKDFNLYNLDYCGLLPKESQFINISLDYIDTYCQFDIELDIEIDNDDSLSLYINDNGSIIQYEEYNTFYTFAFVNHTKRMYVLFDSELLENNFMKQKYKNTIICTNDLVKKIVLYLMASHSSFGRGSNEDSNGFEEYIGMWCGDVIGFEKNNQKIARYENISNIFKKKSRSYSLSL